MTSKTFNPFNRQQSAWLHALLPLDLDWMRAIMDRTDMEVNDALFLNAAGSLRAFFDGKIPLESFTDAELMLVSAAMTEDILWMRKMKNELFTTLPATFTALGAALKINGIDNANEQFLEMVNQEIQRR